MVPFHIYTSNQLLVLLDCLIHECHFFTYTGYPGISGMTFDSVSRTLTCTSSGGPATAVTWRRNCLVLQNSSDFVQNQVVTKTALATYENTLRVNGANIDGVYTCSVKNSRGYSNFTTGIGSKFTTECVLDHNTCTCSSLW